MHGAILGSPLMMLVALPAEEAGEPGPIEGNQVTSLICLLKYLKTAKPESAAWCWGKLLCLCVEWSEGGLW